MHDLRKQECEKALEYIWDLSIEEVDRELLPYKELHNSVKIIKELIEEHFSNPPLAWEEIEEGDFVWDKHFTVIGGQWLKVYEKRITEYGEKVVVCGACGCGVVQTRSYVEDRFYRKEVHG